MKIFKENSKISGTYVGSITLAGLSFLLIIGKLLGWVDPGIDEQETATVIVQLLEKIEALIIELVALLFAIIQYRQRMATGRLAKQVDIVKHQTLYTTSS